MPETPWCEALFSRNCTVFSIGHIVYTEDVGGSSPSSPTTFLKGLRFSGSAAATKTATKTRIEQPLCGPNRPFAFNDVSRLQVARFNARWYARHLIGKGGSAWL
jgi:hypothetical protein